LGNKAYAAGDYAEAVKEYKAIVDGGEYSFELYYNLGNAYYKADSVGKAILYYNKALRVDPSQEDARHNLTLAEKRITDNVAEESEFFLAKWMRGLRNTMSCTAWSVLSLVSFAALLTFALLFLLASRISLRKTGFYCALVALLLFVATISFAISSRNDMLTHDQAIILSSSISTKSSPDRSATELFVLHEGTKVRVVSEHNGWSEVVLADGKKGWIENIHIERI
jgi:tetratricopeptide (TPR) repeat protein